LEELKDIQKEINNDRKIERTLNLFEILNVKEKCISVMDEYNLRAINALEAIKTDESKEKLKALFKILQQRQY
jgi:ATP-dependent RNA circularization protein (DNA/RNA ligase family)